MEIEGRLVREHVHVIVMDVHAIGHLLDDDAALPITDEPMQQGLLLSGNDLRDKRHVFQRFLDFVNGVEIARDPQREFERGDVLRPFDRLMCKRRIAREIQSGNRQAVFVGAVEIHWAICHDHAHAQYRVRFILALRAECVIVVVAARCGQDGLSVGEAPIKVATEIHVAVIVGETDASAHNELPSIRMEFAVCLMVSAIH